MIIESNKIEICQRKTCCGCLRHHSSWHKSLFGQ